MIDKLISKIIEQSLDELKFKNLIVVVPLTDTKLDNILRSLIGPKAIVIDLNADLTTAEVAATFTNAEGDGAVVLRNLDRGSKETLYFLTQMLSERELSLQLEGNSDPVKIPISNCPIIALLESPDRIPNELSEYFNCQIDITSNELPSPLTLEEEDEDYTSDTEQDDFNDRSDGLIKTAHIYNWRDGGRDPDLDSDLPRIKDVLFNNDEEDDPSSDTYDGGILQVGRAYLDYLIFAYGYNRELESEVCDVLCRKDGVYRDVLTDVYNKIELSFSDAAPKSESEFLDNEDLSVYYGTLEQYMNDQPLKLRLQFLYRILVLFDFYEPGNSSTEFTDIEPTLPSDSDMKDQIYDLMERVFWKLKHSSPQNAESHSLDEPQDRRFGASNQVEEMNMENMKVVFHLRVTNAVTGRDEEEVEAEFDVDSADSEVAEKLAEFSSEQNAKSFCYLVYHFISPGGEDLENSEFNKKYFDQFKDTFEYWHRRRFGWASYGVYVNGITINGEKWSSDDENCGELFASEWANTIDAYHEPGDNIRISNGWGSYEPALEEIGSK